MIKIINTEEFSYFLRVNRNEIIKRWMAKNEVQNVLHRHSLPIIEKNTHLFYEFCDCFISVIEWRATVSECHVKIEFLQLLNNYNVTTADLFSLITKLKNAIEEIIYENGNLSFALQSEIESLTLQMGNDLASNFEIIIGGNQNYKSENSNLLAEYKKAVDLSNIVSKTNPKGVITYVNDKFCEISGYSRDELVGKPHNIIRHPDMPREAFKDLWDTIKAKKSWNGVVTNMKKEGGQYIVDTTVIPILDVDGDIVEYIAIRHDITELEETKQQLKNINKAMKNKVDELYSMTNTLEQKAYKDNLTGINNRENFEEIFALEIGSANLNNQPLSLIIFDVDNFKLVNDTYGHQAGDILLKDVVSLIANNIKNGDIFARWGGEEFVILTPATDLNGAYNLAENLRKLVQTYMFKYVENTLTLSFGIAQLSKEDTKKSLFEKADKAMYEAKNNGRNRTEIYQG
ncbi:MAG: sensor domain-containing diguanylate cyclase [Sulfuricurvum sp.]|uniref:sensor domain-containing diguanylate cyclase n=1 Tax=Sulfuricurvum sp. TaxID=2025608 RepID=UPI002637A4D8|nr:sensor domain-containing diguanylate cyclase [Sulfuricurvum sp.]MDD2950103.1 sensor domain-containing diguanylate cyclase [Sulfuricurvum sp.]MDD5117657.1 sensor domain-containing diguanylate cyclase [Sulfuricurvum sp.]